MTLRRRQSPSSGDARLCRGHGSGELACSRLPSAADVAIHDDGQAHRPRSCSRAPPASKRWKGLLASILDPAGSARHMLASSLGRADLRPFALATGRTGWCAPPPRARELNACGVTRSRAAPAPGNAPTTLSWCRLTANHTYASSMQSGNRFVACVRSRAFRRRMTGRSHAWSCKSCALGSRSRRPKTANRRLRPPTPSRRSGRSPSARAAHGIAPCAIPELSWLYPDEIRGQRSRGSLLRTETGPAQASEAEQPARRAHAAAAHA